MTPQEKARWLSEFYAAVAAGKTAQCRSTGWEDIDLETLCGPDMTSNPDEWRIKPEPRRMWEATGKGVRAWTFDKDEADGWEARGFTITEWVEVM